MPFSFKVSLISVHPTPGWQTRSESSSERQSFSDQQWRSQIGEEHTMNSNDLIHSRHVDAYASTFPLQRRNERCVEKIAVW
jgi:hypothetical protein